MSRAWLRWWPLLYVIVFGVEAGSCWGAHSLLFLRLGITVCSFAGAMWFLAWLGADHARKAAEAERNSETEAEHRRAMMRAGSWLN